MKASFHAVLRTRRLKVERTSVSFLMNVESQVLADSPGLTLPPGFKKVTILVDFSFVLCLIMHTNDSISCSSAWPMMKYANGISRRFRRKEPKYHHKMLIS